MSQHDMDVANQAGAAFRADLNNALQAQASNQAGGIEPAVTYPHQLWADTTTGLLKIRNAANNAWFVFGALGVDNLGLIGPASILFFPTGTPPAGYLKANGGAVSRTTYASIFNVIGTAFGAGDGSTTFNLPDLRGYAVRCWDDGRGIDTGRAIGSLQGDGIKQSSFVMRYALDGQLGGYYPSGEFSSFGSVGTLAQVNASSGAGTSITTLTMGSVPETRMKNIALLGCIKF